MADDKLTSEQWDICADAAKKVIDTLNKEIDILHESRHDKDLPPFEDAVIVIMAIFSSYGLLKLKSISTNDKDEEIKSLFMHYCQATFDLVNQDYWEFGREH